MQSNQPYPPPAAPAPKPPHRRRANRMAFASAAAGLLAIAAVAAGGALASAGASRGHHATRTALSHRQPAHPRATKPKPYGAVISTRIRNAAGELVFYAVHIYTPQLPKTTFGVMGGYREADGKLTADVLTNEYSGSDTAPGFHAAEAPVTVNGRAIPEFGYYAGPAAKITGKLDGRTIRAGQARWSVNPKIVIFWFSPRDNPAAKTVTGLTAYNAAGKKLPAGHNSVGVG